MNSNLVRMFISTVYKFFRLYVIATFFLQQKSITAVHNFKKRVIARTKAINIQYVIGP